MNYDILTLQNQIVSLHSELAELRCKIKIKINELEKGLTVDGGRYYCINTVRDMIRRELVELLE